MTTLTLPAWMEFIFSAVWQLISMWQFWVVVASATVWWLLKRRLQTKSVSVGLPFGLGSITYDTTPADRVLAWKLYVQLVTRKAALPFDRDYDLITEVFDSLLELFRLSRSLLSDLPPLHYSTDRGVAMLVLRVLNDGVRPLLTRWQADFRHWSTTALAADGNRDKTPQEIQRMYPRYDDLVADLETMNTELSKFGDELSAIASGPSKRLWRWRKIKPRPPTLSAHAQGAVSEQNTDSSAD